MKKQKKGFQLLTSLSNAVEEMQRERLKPDTTENDKCAIDEVIIDLQLMITNELRQREKKKQQNKK